MGDSIYHDPDNSEEWVPPQKLKALAMTSSNNSSTASPPQGLKDKSGKKKNSVLRKILLSNKKTDAKRGMGIRVGERRKRAKKVFDPSDNIVPNKKKRGRPVGSLNKSSLRKQYSNTSNSKSLKTYSQKSKSDSVESSNEDETNDSQNFAVETNSKVTGGVCSVCRQYKSLKDNSEKLVGCRDCSNKAHPPCLQGDGMLRLRPDNTWQCPHCKTCVVCIETTDAGVLTVCNICADPYHALCHVPPIPESSKAWNQWECKNCQETKTVDSNYLEKMPGSDRSSKMSDWSDSIRNFDRRRDKSNGKNGDSDEKKNSKYNQNDRDRSFSPIHRANPKWNYSRKLVSPDNHGIYDWKSNDDTQDANQNDTDKPKTKRKYSKCNTNIEETKNANDDSIFMNNHDLHKFYNDDIFQKNPNHNESVVIDISIPDAQDWTFVDVFQYFSTYFPEEAHVFKEQEIDGKSLLMMRRNDVLNSLKLPLGQALKIYSHVIKLQSRKDDMTMCWF